MLPNYNDSLYNYTTSVQKGLDCYITAELPADEIRGNSTVLPVGNGTVFKDKYPNEPLLKGQQYFVYERAIAYYDKVGAYFWKQCIVIFGQLIEYVL